MGLWLSATSILATTVFVAASAFARERPFHRQSAPLYPGSGGLVAMPYPFADSTGNIWRINSNGWIQEEGASPAISQGSLLYVNGNASEQQSDQARLDAATGELVVENMKVGGVSITRR